MPPANVQVVERLFRAFNDRDMPAFLDLLDPAVEWVPILGVLEGRVYRGHDDVRRWVEALDPDWELFEVHYEELRDLGDRVLIFGHWRARGRASGVEFENQPATWVYDLKGGKVTRLQTFTDRAEALAAVGLEE
jgi:ketosteroid isomerase-like protein